MSDVFIWLISLSLSDKEHLNKYSFQSNDDHNLL